MYNLKDKFTRNGKSGPISPKKKNNSKHKNRINLPRVESRIDGKIGLERLTVNWTNVLNDNLPL